MKNLFPLNNAFAHFESIADSKHNPIRARLNRLKSEVQIHYDNYKTLAEARRLNNIVNANYLGVNRTALLNCYNSNTVSLNQLKSDIKLIQSAVGQSYCQYCMVRTPDTFDHYIPKEDFSEYSVLSLNLIPCCDQCNRKKTTHWLIAGNRIFLHLYYDDIISYKVLYCRIQFNSNVPTVTFSVRNNRYLSNVDNDLIKEHYLRLGLIKLFQERANVVISETVRTIKSVKSKMTKKQIFNFLITEAKSLQRDYGINYWEALIKRELANNDIFLSSVYNL